MKILVVRLDHLGDLLLTTPLVRALAVAGHDVDVLVRRAVAPVFAHSPHVRNCVSIEEVAPEFPRGWWALSRWLRSQKYDLIILAYAKEKRLCFASAFSGTRRRIAMWSGLWGRLTLHRCLRSEILTDPRPFSQILLHCAEAVGAPAQGIVPELFLSDAERTAARALIPPSLAGRTLIGIHPGSAGNACNLPSKIYAELAAQVLQETECGIVLTGVAAEASLLTDWPAEVLQSERIWNAVGKLDLRQLAAVIGQLNVYVCSSTGPLHIASALGIGTVSPFCPEVPLNAAIWGNVGALARVIEPANCPRRTGQDACCDFRGEISAGQLLTEIRDLLGADRK
ncbi:MAG: glycosyltransferase family 9 protein [Spartobacteria bacterium]